MVNYKPLKLFILKIKKILLNKFLNASCRIGTYAQLLRNQLLNPAELRKLGVFWSFACRDLRSNSFISTFDRLTK